MYLGLDIGTSGVKALLIDERQSILESSHASLDVSRPKPAWSEQSPDDWIKATKEAIEDLVSKKPQELAALKGIGLSGQMHGATLLDTADRPLRPAILWNDGRSEKECAELEANCPNAREIAGNIAMPGFTAPKLLWVKKHEPELFDQVQKVLLPKDYVRLWLTGDYISDMSDSAGTLWLDVEKRAWSDELLSATHLTKDHMPSLVEGSQQGGELRSELKASWGMNGPVIVAGGGGDNAASACGIGAVKPGAGFASLGTSGVLFISNSQYSPNTQNAVHAFCHALPGTWHQMGVILSAADSLEWLSKITSKSASELSGELTSAPDAPAATLFLPYLSGERTPHNDANARGSFIGLSQVSDTRELTQAVFEGVAFAFADCLMALKDAGTEPGDIFAIGGGSRSKIWLQILSNCLNLPLLVPTAGDFGGAFGAARLAICATTQEDPGEICIAPAVEEVIEPEQQKIAAYHDQHQRYRTAYPTLKSL